MKLFLLHIGNILIDEIDISTALSGTWRITRGGYIYGRSGKYKDQYLHIVIAERMGLDFPNQVDHIDGNPLNNQRDNLRPATHSQNMWNRKKQTNNTSGHVGVYRVGDKYRARIRFHGKLIHLGCFDTYEEAIKVRKEAEIKYFGEFIRNVQ